MKKYKKNINVKLYHQKPNDVVNWASKPLGFYQQLDEISATWILESDTDLLLFKSVYSHRN